MICLSISRRKQNSNKFIFEYKIVYPKSAKLMSEKTVRAEGVCLLQTPLRVSFRKDFLVTFWSAKSNIKIIILQF